MKTNFYLWIIILFISSSKGFAQRSLSESKSNPKIGLVLSGGGAKCMAQIGALRVIEEAGIEIDYISGTSMGAIVGAMYAMGYTVDEIEDYLRKVDWDALLVNEIPRNRLTYFDRKAEDRYLFTFPIRDHKIELPSGLNYAQYILKQLSFLTQKSYQYETFSDFPIPFLCVATNLENGKMEVFEDGRIIDALRASSSFPSLFSPYPLNDKLYADGGIVNNFPVAPLKEKGMDYIIGIDVQDFLYTKDELNSVVRILEQTSSFRNANEYLKQLDSIDILIKPEIPEAGITTFNLFDTIVARGEQAARLQLKNLKNLANIDHPKKLSLPQPDATPMNQFFIRSITIKGNKSSSERFILGKLRLNENTTYSKGQLHNGLDRLYGSKYFENVDYIINPQDSGYELVIKVVEKPSLSQFRVGLHYDNDYKTAALLNYTQRNLLFKNSRLSLDLAIGENPRVSLNYFVDRGLLPTFGFRFRANRFEANIYNETRDPINQLTYIDYSTDFFFQSTFKDAYAIGGGIQLEGVALNQNLNTLDQTNLNSDYINYYGFLDFDSFNDASYPTEGFKFSAMGRIIARQENLVRFYEPSSVIDVSYSQAASYGDDLSITATIFGATTIGPDIEYPYNIFFGSMGKNYINYIKPFIGYRYMELQGRSGISLRADLYYQFTKRHYLTMRGNVGKLEKVSFGELFGSDILLDGYSLGYSFDSPAGPLEINVTGSTNHSDIYTYISLGFWF